MSFDPSAYSFAEVRSLIKLSKSGPIDTGPYHLINWDLAGDWGELVNRYGAVVGQPTGLDLQRAGLKRR